MQQIFPFLGQFQVSVHFCPPLLALMELWANMVALVPHKNV